MLTENGKAVSGILKVRVQAQHECILCVIWYKCYDVYCVMCIVRCALCDVYCVMCIVRCVLCDVYCVMCIV